MTHPMNNPGTRQGIYHYYIAKDQPQGEPEEIELEEAPFIEAEAPSVPEPMQEPIMEIPAPITWMDKIKKLFKRRVA